jgi:hypothetical protein
MIVLILARRDCGSPSREGLEAEWSLEGIAAFFGLLPGFRGMFAVYRASFAAVKAS